jgi:chromosome segregation ATPase
MSSWWDKVKKSGQKTKLRADIALAERECKSRKKKFGVDLYDVLTTDKQKLLGLSAGTLFKGTQQELKTSFESAKNDIGGMELRKDEIQKKRDVLEVKGSHTMPDTTVGEKASKAGKAVADAATDTKLRAQIALIDREIKIRKEDFGIEVFEAAKVSEEKAKGIKGAVSSAISNLSDHEKQIQAVIDQAKAEVDSINKNIQSLERQMNLLDSEMEPLTG